MMFGDRTIYCPRCKRETWDGDTCPATNKTKKCQDGTLEKTQKPSK
jgi:hypothetical protein